MKNIKIFQIFYDEHTKRNLDPGFIPLDNASNARPDWREYWPIRNYLLNNELEEDGLYGFFSPKFKEKTGLTAADCHKFIEKGNEEVDVFSFSPFFDIGAFFQNSFFQCYSQHPNSQEPIDTSLKILEPNLDLNNLVMHSGNNIFCNFFVAKPIFWKAWIKKCELIWTLLEQANACDIHISALNDHAAKHDSPAPIKTFLIERIASLILATDHDWKVAAYNPFELPFSNAPISREGGALIQMDALKIAYSNQGRAEYLQLFKHLAGMVLSNLNTQTRAN